MADFIILGLCGLLTGVLLALIVDYIERRKGIQKAKVKAEEIIHEARDKEELLFQKIDKKSNQQKRVSLSRFEREEALKNQRLEGLQSAIDKRADRLRLKTRQQSGLLEKLKRETSTLKGNYQNLISQIKDLDSQLKQSREKLILSLKNGFSFDIPSLKDHIKSQIEKNCFQGAVERIRAEEKAFGKNIREQALFYLNSVLNRFQRAYCPERGIESVSFHSKALLRRALGPDRAYLNQLEKECGVDVVANEEDLSASIYGIDPVRRELGRLTLKKLSKKKHINFQIIRSLVKACKRDLFRRIEKDGTAVGLRLGVKNIPKPVRNMMGALRYRYSFAQNQHFHCEEVGWLCGLLSSELSLPLSDGRRAGLFHDIGKAMDHAVEGNHAVIGADFISKHGEKEEVVHAIRAHHHDESPSTALAWLVISADAVSGSRPGARRFTEHSYARKLATMENIIDSFENIENAYIMNAGREMRVIVKNKKVDDLQALCLSKAIARKIEERCSYPGLIKVTVVRHSEVSAVAR